MKSTKRCLNISLSHGFTLIELLITILISSMLATLLFTAFNQIRTFVPAVDRFADLGTKAAIVAHQLEKDLLGAHVPMQTLMSLAQEKKENQNQAPKKTEQANEKEEKKKKRKPLKHIFFSSNQGDNLEKLTFISHNPLQRYPSQKSQNYIPRSVRVTYRLKKEKENEKGKVSYQLLRKEAPGLDEKEDASIKEFVVIDGIKSFSVEYFALKKIQQKETKEPQLAPNAPKQAVPKKNENKKIQYELIEKKEWDVNIEEQSDEPMVPSGARIKLSLWDAQRKRSQAFTLGFTIPFTPVVHPPEKPESKSQAEKDKDLTGVFKKLIKGASVPPDAQKQLNSMNGQRPPIPGTPGKPPAGASIPVGAR